MLVIEGKEDGVDDLIERLVSNVNSTEPGTIVYEYFKSSNGQVSLYEVYKDDRAAQFHAISFLNGNLRKEFEETFEVKNFQVLGNSSNKLKEIMTVYTRDHRKITNGFRR
jgi:quinol monooxygenase YgiN